jgi:hypothetical protein
MFKQSLITAALFTLLAAGSANAALVVDTGTPNNSGSQLLLDGNDWLAGQVTFNQSLQITSIQAYLDEIFPGSGGDFNVTLYSDNGSNKIGSQLYSGVATYSSTGWNGLSNLSWAVSSGKYWVGLEVDGNTQSSSLVAAQYSPNQLANTAFSADGGSSYSYRNISGTGLNSNMSFGVQIAAVPEPDTYAMLMAGLGLIGFVARRKQA